MTVETSIRKETFSGGQASLTFTFRTLVSNPEYIKVKLKNVSSGVETDLTYSTDYTVAVDSDGVGGTVTVSPTYSTSYNYVVFRETSPIQQSDYDDFNQFPASTLEGDIDRVIMIAQEQAEETDRTLRYPISASGTSTELPTPTADAYLAWNSAGTAVVNKTLPNPSTLVKASQVVAEAATNDTDFMTALQVKNEVQKSGAVLIPYANLTGIPTTGTSTIINAVYPVGSIYTSIVSTNPGTLLGTGTWVAFGAGRVLVGFDGGQSEFDTVEETGGEKTHALTADENGAHTHTVTVLSGGSGTGNGGFSNTNTGATGSSGLGTAHNNLQPYIVVYLWKRTA